ncbi:MAG: hypothetical protein GF387_03310 [Candidatus Portnoybacteria bacterium]|nr:hypothetical protein [Candidatus Portnoybacteria bacterium]
MEELVRWFCATREKLERLQEICGIEFSGDPCKFTSELDKGIQNKKSAQVNLINEISSYETDIDLIRKNMRKSQAGVEGVSSECVKRLEVQKNILSDSLKEQRAQEREIGSFLERITKPV